LYYNSVPNRVYLSERTRVRRQPSRGAYDAAAVDAVLDAVLVAHVGFVDGGQPFCIPMLQARAGKTVHIHGSSASRAIRVLGQGAPACLAATVVDGLVLARSAFEHSANYRSVVLLGRFEPISNEGERLAAFELFTNKLLPGRWGEVRRPNPKELRASAILRMPIREASVKVRSGPPSDDESADADLPIRAGVVPLVSHYGRPEPSPRLRDGIPLAESALRLVDGRSSKPAPSEGSFKSTSL
jgi:uncharacterized protein